MKKKAPTKKKAAPKKKSPLAKARSSLKKAEHAHTPRSIARKLKKKKEK